jgi:hypothetical protein
MIKKFTRLTRFVCSPLAPRARMFSTLSSNSYAVPLSQQSSLEDEVNNFFNSITSNEKEMSLQSLTDFMSRSFIERHFSFEEHQNYYPLIEELVFYAKQWSEQNAHQNATIEQAMILVKFGSAFDVQDHQYWRFA